MKPKGKEKSFPPIRYTLISFHKTVRRLEQKINKPPDIYSFSKFDLF